MYLHYLECKELSTATIFEKEIEKLANVNIPEAPRGRKASGVSEIDCLGLRGHEFELAD